MHVDTFVVIKDPHSIKVLVDNLEDIIGSILEDIDVCAKGQDFFRNGIDKIKGKNRVSCRKSKISHSTLIIAADTYAKREL